jgi:DNA-binding protein H-NS
LQLRNDVEATLESRLANLQLQMSQFASKGERPKHKFALKKRTRKVAAKYKGPNGETWSGRGLKPRWLTAEIKKGKKLESFAIAR